MKLNSTFLVLASDYHEFEQIQAVLSEFNPDISYVEVSNEIDKKGVEYDVYSAIFFTGDEPLPEDYDITKIPTINLH